jgi:hypothetical protein
MKRVWPVLAIVILLAGTFAISGCSRTPDASQTNTSQTNANKPQTDVITPATARTTATGTLTANPNPIKVCDKSETGVTTLSWTSAGALGVQVRVGKPDGDLFAAPPSGQGTVPTGKWVKDGMKFYLQDVSGGKPLTPENTITTLTVNVTREGCP